MSGEFLQCDECGDFINTSYQNYYERKGRILCEDCEEELL